MVYKVEMLPSHSGHCTSATTVVFMSSLTSTLLILNMTFERFYSIIRPQKAASFNTVKRAKITIVGIVVFSILYNIPHMFITGASGTNCNAYGTARNFVFGDIYYWLSFILNFALPFMLLFFMNSVIIYTLRRRSAMFIRSQGQGQS